ncbi:MAG: O-antigen ligase family protein, partial [Acidobacteriota bacterium]
GGPSTPGPGADAGPAAGFSYQEARAYDRRRRQRLFLMVGGHVALAVAVSLIPGVALAHALGTLAVGLALAGSQTPIRAVYVIPYIAGAELIWRISKSTVVWEYGKYATLLLLLVLFQRLKLRPGLRPLAVTYFAFLMPAVAVTIGALGLSDNTRQALSSSLSGPVALTALVIFFSGLDSSRLDLHRLLLSLMAPMITVLTMAMSGTVSAGNIRFGTYSNFATSAGYGPNQVSSILGLGGLVCLLLLLHEKEYRSRLVLVVFTLAFFLQTILTFSRGGVLNVIVCAILFGVHYLSNRRLQRALLGATVVLVVAGINLLPVINTWTGGSLEARFSDFDTTGRKEIAEADLIIWKENPVLGAGAGMSGWARRKILMRKIAAHTEYTRLLSEHGIFGGLALLCMGLISFQAYRRAPTMLAKGWVAGMTGWTLTAMSHVSMRIVAISLLFGLATLRWHQGSGGGSGRPRGDDPGPVPVPPTGPRPLPATADAVAAYRTRTRLPSP